jgi:uncharacterized membrane protein YqhA
MVYFYVITFFVAVLTLDEQRISAKKNAVIPCIVHEKQVVHDLQENEIMLKIIQLVHKFLIAPTIGKVFKEVI